MEHQFNSLKFDDFLTIAMVLITGVYVYLTWKIANANHRMLDRVEEQHKEEIRPNVYARIEFREQVVVRLIIENMGRSPAYKMRIRLSEDFYQFAEKNGLNLRELSTFNDEIDWFPPSARIALDLTQGFNFDVVIDDRNITPSRFIVDLMYSSKFDKYEEQCLIDLAPYMGTNIPISIAEQLGRIESHLKKMASK